MMNKISGSQLFSFKFHRYGRWPVRCVFFCILFFITFSCRRYHTQQAEQDTNAVELQKKEVLLRVNQQLVEEEAGSIGAYVKRSGWQMHTTESGLWYMIYEHGQGEKASTGKVATLACTLSLMDGTVCYSGPKTFRLGQGGVETGLEEGILLMSVGDKARMIMPPHLAHGLTGDGNCIPQRAIILYDVELLSLK